MSRPFLSGSVADVCFDLVATASEYGDEQALADAVENRVRSHGIVPERIGNSIVARTGGPGAATVLVGHLDTVPNWNGGVAERTDQRIVGRGASDMKGGVAVMLRLLERMIDAPQPVAFIFYDREEGPNSDNGIHRVLADSTLLDPKPKLAVVLEPTASTIHAGAVGSFNARVVFRGKSAHSARPWEGDNAISLAFAEALTRFAQREPVPVEVDGLLYHDVVTVTMLNAGIAHNVLPDRVELSVNVRIAPGRSVEAAQAEVLALAGPEAELTWLDTALPAEPRLSDPIVSDFVARSGLAVLPKQAWTDVATLQEWGVPAFNYGPGEPSQAHQPGEWVEIAMLEECERVLAEELGAP